MYLQNSLIAIESAKSNEINYAVYLKFLFRQQALGAIQTQYQDLKFGTGVGILPQVALDQSNINESTDAQSISGDLDS